MTQPAATGFSLLLWLVVGFPVAAVAAVPLVRRFDRAALPALALLPAATCAAALTQLPAALDGGWAYRLDWVPALSLALDVRWDALSAIMTVVVTAIGAGVLVYSSRYFPADDDGLPRYTGLLLAFAGAMLGVVLADNLVLLVIAWELTGLLSYLLIGLRYRTLSTRRSAAQAFVVTSAGGLVMLVGAILLGVHAGTFRLSEIIAAPPVGTVVDVAVALLLIGGLSKSAIIPFSFWLPGAMAAPTPASAYLHAATMVKAGVYLFARLAPAFALSPVWAPVLVTLGVGTMVYGAVVALRQRDLKLLLAYGTVSQLGLITLLIGAGTADLLLAALAMLIAHAAFKASLFFVVGLIDTGAGTRKLTELSGLGRAHPVLCTVAVVAGLSMAGLPPLVGFVAKEAGITGLLEAGGWGVVGLGGMILGSVLTVAYTARFIWGAFGTKRWLPTTDRMTLPASMTVPTGVLAAVGLLFGVVPSLVEPLVATYAQTAGEVHDDALALWHGITPALLISIVVWLLGGAVFALQRRREGTELATPGGEPGAGYRVLTGGVLRFARRLTSATQRGSLPVSLGAILVVLLVFPGSLLIRSGVGPGPVRGPLESPVELALCGAIALLAVVVLRCRRGLTAVLFVGGIGYLVAVVFVTRGAPDLALTQLLVETVTLVAAVLLLRRLPDTALHQNRRGNGVRLALAIAVGVLMTAFALILPGVRTQAPVSDLMAGPAQDFGGGTNLVNVVLVDIRGWDTFGELLVLVAAATGVASLVFVSRRTGRVPRAPKSTGKSGVDRPSPWLVTNWSQRPSLLLEVIGRLLFHTLIVFSVYLLFAGHDAPGGGFAGGLVAGLALTLRYIAGGAYELGEAAPWDVGRVLGLGVLVSVVTAAFGVVSGGAALQSEIWKASVPVLGDLKLVTSTFFDIGVYLVVIGVVLDLLRSLGAGLDQQPTVDRTGSTIISSGARR
ncbi:Na+/H+ antiporter subunit A [Nakamurella deserti]|uniref:Na+/H+ antiporter subunit A n=1 Tax=Nakamurella deserti TaxID=2164074 RepID=UPI000DBE9033|nr:Na+/H+ antiporter subunit A [Nakamurella deserti]